MPVYASSNVIHTKFLDKTKNVTSLSPLEHKRFIILLVLCSLFVFIQKESYSKSFFFMFQTKNKHKHFYF